MPQKVLRFTGINRKVNEFEGTGNCEELINLRPSRTGFKIVRQKSPTAKLVNFSAVTEHKFGATENMLAITDSAVKWVDKNGVEKQTLSDTDGAKDISCAGNVIVITRQDKAQKVFKFEDNTYSEYSVSVPSIKMWVDLDKTLADDKKFTTYASHTNSETSIDAAPARGTLASAYSNFYKSNPHGLAGPILIGCTFELEDGSEIWSSGFSIVDPAKDVRFKAAEYKSNTAYVYGAREAVLNFSIENSNKVSGVKNIKFYSSLPLTPYDIEDIGNTLIVSSISKNDMNIAGQQMYLQKVLSFRGSGSFKLNTEHDLAANDLMPVTAGTIYRTGDNVSYNNRFHFFNSSVEHTLQSPSIGRHDNAKLPDDSPNQSPYTDIRKARLSIIVDNGTEKIRVYWNTSFDVQMGATMDFIYPMGGIKQGYLEVSDDEFKTITWYAKTSFICAASCSVR